MGLEVSSFLPLRSYSLEIATRKKRNETLPAREYAAREKATLWPVNIAMPPLARPTSMPAHRLEMMFCMRSWDRGSGVNSFLTLPKQLLTMWASTETLCQCFLDRILGLKGLRSGSGAFLDKKSRKERAPACSSSWLKCSAGCPGFFGT